MHDEQAFREPLALISTGQLKDAHKFLLAHKQELQRTDLLLFDVLLADVNLQRGDLTAARQMSERLLRETELPAVKASAHRLIAEIHANQLEFEESLDNYAAARAVFRAGVPDGIRAGVELSFWGWFAGVLPLETTESEFSAVRRAVVRAGQPQHFSELRLCAARLEARKGCLIEAQRHWDLAKRLLEREPNLKLAAQMLLDGCMISLLSGDVRTALERAVAAQQSAEASGYYRAIVGSLINRGHVLHAMGDLPNARAMAELAVARADGHKQLHVAALDCLANVLLAQGDMTGAEKAFEEIGGLRPTHGTRLALHWDVLSELSSRVALAKSKGRAEDEAELINQGVRTATSNRDKTWLARMQLSLAELRLHSGDLPGAVPALFIASEYAFPSPELLARVSAATGLAAYRSGDRIAAVAAYRRGERIAKAMENPALLTELKNECSELVDKPTIAALDDSVALIELGGYPHVLAREAFALLELTGATEAMALVARADAATRCVKTTGWTEDEARVAAAEPGQRLHIRCGLHRDESWEIVAALKPTLNDRCAGVAIRKLVDTAVTLDRYRREEKQRAALWPADTLETDGGLWVSEQMTELLSIARRIAPADITVLLTGETGTGKEVLARAIHRASGRGAKPFVPFNCTAVPRDMLESQLFGYRKGAFTGADAAFDGVIRAATGGTLFLDEIAEIGPDLQPKLLRFLETREVHGLGEAQPVKVDVRIIAATNADLEALVADNRFREDLFYRLNVVRLRLPPLRERREEIPPLIDHYLRQSAEEQKKGRLTLDDETLEYLVLYAWPGNVRQLVNEISRVVAYAEPDGTITPALLSPEIQASRRTVRVLPGDEPEIRIRLDQPMNDAVEAIERLMVARALQRARGNYENAAKLLGISRKGLF
ncbi:MAG TPA: sigma 54-interacting transcriptional regulator, partial [Vicinamibacterales bacterium]|nr:sigma 54-interacting transcriptional regulator [Vicinamibacterales bacterium]